VTTWAEVSPVTTAWAKPTMPTTAYAEPAAVASAWAGNEWAGWLTNHSFETALDAASDWEDINQDSGHNGASFARYATASANDGAYVARCTLEADGTDYLGYRVLTHVPFAVTPGQTYTVTCKVRVGTAAGTALGNVGMELIDSAGTIDFVSKAWDTLTTSWATMTVSFVADEAVLGISIYARALPGNTRQYPCYADNVVVTQGPGWVAPTAVTTAWSES